jgi:hypothetical protein
MKYKFYVCHICSWPIPEAIAHYHPLFGTLDHVIPLSKGGTSLPDNILPAHRFCNAYKGDRELTGEMRIKCHELVIEEFAKAPVLTPATNRFKGVRKYVKKLLRMKELKQDLKLTD